MKKLLLFLGIFILMGGFIFARGADVEVKEAPIEDAGPRPLDLFVGGFDLEHPDYQQILKPFAEEFPNIQLHNFPVDLRDGSSVSMDTRIAAGLPVHLYDDFYSRAGKFAVTKDAPGNPTLWAIDLAKYWPKADIDAFVPEIIGPYITEDGQVLAVPSPLMVVGMLINVTICGKAGYELPPPEDWTIKEFLKMCEKVKAANIPDTFGTGMFAGNRSGDWHFLGFFSSFGANRFENNDYSKTTINTPAGLKTFEFWQLLLKKGYIPADAATSTDDWYCPARDGGYLAAAGGRLGNYNKPEVHKRKVESDYSKERFWSVFYPFPKAPGVEKVPLLVDYNLTVAIDNGDEYTNSVAAKLAWYMGSTRAQTIWSGKFKQIAAMTTVPDPFDVGEDKSWFVAGKQILLDNGKADVGGSLPFYGELRNCLPPVNQLFFTGQLTAQEALDMYEKNINDVIAENVK